MTTRLTGGHDFYNWINRIIKLYNKINLKKNKY